MFQIYRLQDIQVDDVALKTEYYTKFLNGDISGAQAIYNANPQLKTKVLEQNMLNSLLNGILGLEGLYDTDVTQFLSDELNRFQININELIYMDDYSPTIQYEVNNFVLYNNSVYYCFNMPPIGTVPTNVTYWLNLDLKGVKGDETLSVVYKGGWLPAIDYKKFDMVVYNNNLYVARVDNKAISPTVNATWLLAVEMMPIPIIVSAVDPVLTEGSIWLRLIESATVTCQIKPALQGVTMTLTSGSNVYSGISDVNGFVTIDGITAIGLNYAVTFDNRFVTMLNPNIKVNYLTTYGIVANNSRRVYTVNIDTLNSNPQSSCTYADDAVGMEPGSVMWDEFFGCKPCLFKDGAVVGYLNPNDFTKFEDGRTADITSGNAGDVMIEFPRLGVNINTNGDIVSVQMTNELSDPSFTYYAHTKGSVYKEKFYLGAYKGKIGGTRLRSLSGVDLETTTSSTLASFRKIAQANGVGYEQSGFYQLTFRQCMYILKYKNLNCQKTVGNGSVGGYKLLTTGDSNTRGMTWGSTTTTFEQVKLFGIEDCWGGYNEWVDGIVTDANRNILTSTSDFNNTGIGYENQGISTPTDISARTIKKAQGTSKKGFVIAEEILNLDLYYCDIGSIKPSCAAVSGGGNTGGSMCGIFTLLISINPTRSDRNTRSRLMYL